MLDNETSQLSQLAQKFQLRLEDYVYRATLDRHLAQDITQECLLAMVKVYGQSNQPERFWPWLRQTAHHKICDAFSHRRRQREMIEKYSPQPISTEVEGLQKQVNAELQQAVKLSMSQISLEHRQVLNLRCYENNGVCPDRQTHGPQRICQPDAVLAGQAFIAKAVGATRPGQRGIGDGSGGLR